MIIHKNGIGLEIIKGRPNEIKIFEQTKEASKILRDLKVISDQETGLSIRSNNYPSFRKGEKRIFLRGNDQSKDDASIKIPSNFISFENLCEAIDRLLSKVQKPKGIKDRSQVFAKLNKGNTSHVRMAFLNRKMASILRLTCHEDFPEEIVKWESTDPIITNNQHYNEHIGQIVDVLNKSIKDPKQVEDIINPHKISSASAKWAVEQKRKTYEEALAKGPEYVIAQWRLDTGLRGPDFK